MYIWGTKYKTNWHILSRNDPCSRTLNQWSISGENVDNGGGGTSQGAGGADRGGEQQGHCKGEQRLWLCN